MKKVLLFCLAMMLIFCGAAMASSDITANASPVTTGVNTTTTYVNITFPYPTRSLLIQNNDSADYIYVDLKSDTNTSDTASGYLLGPGDELDLFDFITNGISILRDTTYATGDTASPISVLATY